VQIFNEQQERSLPGTLEDEAAHYLEHPAALLVGRQRWRRRQTGHEIGQFRQEFHKFSGEGVEERLNPFRSPIRKEGAQEIPHRREG
jgi:hypothetical protein